jgi:peptidoglycan-associated lipoprotein
MPFATRTTPVTKGEKAMRLRVLLFMLPLLAACSTTRPVPAPSAAVSESDDIDIAGRWHGHWTGTGLFPSSAREDAVTMDIVQRGDRGQGRLVLDGTGAAESVPEAIRRAGQWGTPVVAKISQGRVTLRHHVDGRLFTADLKVSEDGERMVGLVRGSWPSVGLVLARDHSRKTDPVPAVPQQAAMAPPAAEPVTSEPAPPVIAMAPEPKPEAQEAETPARPRRDEFMAVQELPAVHFDFDKADLRADALDQLQDHAAWLKAHEDAAVLIEGHCDERGTAEYNVALGDRRAKAVRDHFTAYGIAPDRITTSSYGKERQACAADTAACHEMNRRAEFRVKGR